ncbi:T9SS type A sorting domain-containing protein [Croceimicrobium sp.]|uniref:T9SS type A sorting domain-containing protein n=1 Tax=Croceimicrobium sp. TaxID=2828340 RepID=UPI003BA8B07C
MRQVLLSLLLLYSFSSYSQWDSCGITKALNNPNIEAIDAFTHFQGRLYVHTYLSGLQYSDDYGNTWDTLAQSAFNGIPVQFYSHNQKLYASTLVSAAAGGIQYYSVNQGQNWIIDTVGMPLSAISQSYRARVLKAQQMGDYLFYQLNTPNSFYWRHKDSTVYHADAFANGNFMNGFEVYHDTLWASIGGSFYYLSQPRGTFVPCTNTNLPNLTLASILFCTAQKIYMATTDANQDWNLYWTDNRGNSWNTIALQSILGNGAFGQKRGISCMYAEGNEIWLGLKSKGANEKVGILYSADAGANWSLQENNLPIDPFGTNAVKSIRRAGGYLFAEMSFKDVYRQGQNIGLQNYGLHEIKLFPNPSENYFKIQSTKKPVRIVIYDLRGNQMKEYCNMERYSVQDLRSGLYKVQIHFKDGQSSQRNLLIP